MYRTDSDKYLDTITPYYPDKSEFFYALGNVYSAYMMLPGLRGFWPMSSVGSLANPGDATDMSGQNRHLSRVGSPFFTQSFGSHNLQTAFVNYYGTPDYFRRADEAGLDITGKETYISSTDGLTLGCWIEYSSTHVGQKATIMGKWDSAGNQKSYALRMNTDEQPSFAMSLDGTNEWEVTSPVVLTSSWGARSQFICGRFDWHTSMDIFASDHEPNTNTTISRLRKTSILGRANIPEEAFVGTADFTIGAEHGGVNPVRNGFWCALCFLCFGAVPPSVIERLYHISRPLFTEKDI